MDAEGSNGSRREFMGWGIGAGAAAFAAMATAEGPTGPQVPGFDPGYRSVREFGATGDGQEDDTEAFAAALSTGEPVFVPAGNYVIEGTLPRLERWTTIRGVGTQSRIVYRGSDHLFRTDRRSEYVQIDGLRLILRSPGTGAIFLQNTHYARLGDLWIFGSDRGREVEQVGITIDSGRPAGGYWIQGSNILMRRLSEGFRLVNGANASVWHNVTIREAWLPVNIESGYGFQLIGGFIEGWGDAGPEVKPAIRALDDSGVALGVVFEETKPRSYVVEFGHGVRGWVIMGRFNVLGGARYGGGGQNLLINTAHHRYDNLLLRQGGGERPRRPDRYDMFFDAELGRPIWWTGSAWVDALGREV